MTLNEYNQWLSDPDKVRCILILVNGYDTQERTFYISNHEYVTTPTDALPNVAFDARLLSNSLEFTREVSFIDSPRGDTTYGNITIDNTDGGLDNWINFSFSGRKITVLLGDPQWAWADFNVRPFLVGVIENIEFSDTRTFNLVIRDKIGLLDKSINETLLTQGPKKGDPKPLAFGVVRNIEPVLLDENVQGGLYQWHNGAVERVLNVYDNGVLLTPITGYTTDNTNGTITLVYRPVGTITMDGYGAKPLAWLNTAATITTHILKNIAGLTDSDIDSTSMSVLSNNSIGLYLVQRENILDILDRIFASMGCSYFFNYDGKFTVTKISIPSNPMLELLDNDWVLDSPQVKTLGTPVWRYKLGYEVNHTVQNPDQLAGSVTQPNFSSKQRVGWLGSEYRVVEVEDASIKVKYLNAVDKEMVGTLLDPFLKGLTCTTITFQSGQTVRFSFSQSPDLSSIAVGDSLSINTGVAAVNRGRWVITAINNTTKTIDATIPNSSAGNNQTGLTTYVEILATVGITQLLNERFAIAKVQRHQVSLQAISSPYKILPGSIINLFVNRYGYSNGVAMQVLKVVAKGNISELEGWY